jgi:acetyltransferase
MNPCTAPRKLLSLEAPHPSWYSLRDGARVFLRPIAAENKFRLLQAFWGLSGEPRYFRFLRPVSDLTEGELRYLTEVDQASHKAWVALVREVSAQRILGVGRYIRLSGEPGVAEVAFTIIDVVQERGLGLLLFRVLAGCAARKGVCWLRVYVHCDNERMFGLFQRVGPTTTTLEGPVARVDIPLAELRVPPGLAPNESARCSDLQ